MGSYTKYYYTVKDYESKHCDSIGEMINFAMIEGHAIIKNGKIKPSFKIKTYQTYIN